MRRLISWLPPIVYMAAIFYVSSLSHPFPAVTARVSDKILHVIEYGGLSVLFVRAFAREGSGWRRPIATAIVLASLYGASDEFHQSFVPGRDSTVSDWVADTIGAAAGALAYARSAAGFARRFTTADPAA